MLPKLWWKKDENQWAPVNIRVCLYSSCFHPSCSWSNKDETWRTFIDSLTPMSPIQTTIREDQSITSLTKWQTVGRLVMKWSNETKLLLTLTFDPFNNYSIRNFHPTTSNSFQFSFWILCNFVHCLNMRETVGESWLSKDSWDWKKNWKKMRLSKDSLIVQSL